MKECHQRKAVFIVQSNYIPHKENKKGMNEPCDDEQIEGIRLVSEMYSRRSRQFALAMGYAGAAVAKSIKDSKSQKLSLKNLPIV